MIDYGTGPAADELEVTVFGPGFGEAIAVHLGEHHWMLVDSCLDPATKSAASLAYLARLDVSLDCVKSLIASHWHDDHVRGLSEIVAKCLRAELTISGVFNDREATAFLAAFSGQLAGGLSKGAKELYDSINSREDVYFVHQRSIIMDSTIGGRRVQVAALSPVQAALTQSLSRLASFLPTKRGGTPINHAPELEPNVESIVVHIDIDGEAILLAACRTCV